MVFTDSGGFDWSGKSDAFDNYMDMKVSGSNSRDSDGEESGANVSSSSSYKKSSNPNESPIKSSIFSNFASFPSKTAGAKSNITVALGLILSLIFA